VLRAHPPSPPPPPREHPPPPPPPPPPPIHKHAYSYTHEHVRNDDENKNEMKMHTNPCQMHDDAHTNAPGGSRVREIVYFCESESSTWRRFKLMTSPISPPTFPKTPPFLNVCVYVRPLPHSVVAHSCYISLDPSRILSPLYTPCQHTLQRRQCICLLK